MRWGIRAARLFDGERERIGAPLVVIEDGRIAEVDLSGAHPSADLRVVDLGDVTLLPGLVDAHVHLGWDPMGSIETLQHDDDETMIARMLANADAALQAGITTVRDLG